MRYTSVTPSSHWNTLVYNPHTAATIVLQKKYTSKPLFQHWHSDLLILTQKPFNAPVTSQSVNRYKLLHVMIFVPGNYSSVNPVVPTEITATEIQTLRIKRLVERDVCSVGTFRFMPLFIFISLSRQYVIQIYITLSLSLYIYIYI
jgi:hypothetical protein